MSAKRRFETATLVFAVCLAAARPAGAEIQWHTPGGGPGDLAGIATIAVPEGYLFAPRDQMPELNRLTGNLDAPGDIGALVPAGHDRWLAFFVWDEVGYVSDEDKDELDADAMLTAFQDNDEAANEAREAQGYSRLTTLGWHSPPHYDDATQNLTWALTLQSEQGRGVVNHNVRLLGRRGVMEVILAASPEEIDSAIAEFTPLLEGFGFNGGQRYAEYAEGDRLASYGLTGLVLGGGAVLAAKSGLLGLLMKNVKAVVLGGAAAVAGIGAAIRRRFSGRTGSA